LAALGRGGRRQGKEGEGRKRKRGVGAINEFRPAGLGGGAFGKWLGQCIRNVVPGETRRAQPVTADTCRKK
jgi:hypothetical protein